MGADFALGLGGLGVRVEWLGRGGRVPETKVKSRQALYAGTGRASLRLGLKSPRRHPGLSGLCRTIASILDPPSTPPRSPDPSQVQKFFPYDMESPDLVEIILGRPLEHPNVPGEPKPSPRPLENIDELTPGNSCGIKSRVGGRGRGPLWGGNGYEG